MLNSLLYNPFSEPILAPDMSGNTPPILVAPEMSGNTPPILAPTPFPTVTTGGNTPPIASPFPVMSGNTPPVALPQIQSPPAYQLPGSPGFTPASVAANTMNQITDAGGAYMSNARRRGLEFAAARKLGNSSIAAGASERAALEAAQPIFNEAMGLHRGREDKAFQGEQAQFNRNHDYTTTQLDDWKSSKQFNREFYGALSMMPINSAYQLNSMIMSYALDNPEVYTANVVSGMSNFFNQNFQQVLSEYFPDQYSGGV